MIVVGAGGRLGAAVAEALAAREARLVLADADETGLERVGSRIDGRALTQRTDIRDEQDVEALVRRAIDEHGGVDAVVNAAGVEGPVAPLEDVSPEAFADVYEANLFGPLRVLRALLPHFKGRRRGRVVNVASGAGLAGVAYMAAYSSSKHALVGLTRSLAREVAAHGVSVNAVCPGCVDSPMMERIERRLGGIVGGGASFIDSIPAGRYAAPDEVAGLVAYLVLDAPPYLTGEALVIDGGLRA